MNYFLGGIENKTTLTSSAIEFRYDNWDDYTFKTTFIAYLVKNSESVLLGYVHIGVAGEHQTNKWLAENNLLSKRLQKFPSELFLLGDDQYYKNISEQDNASQIFADTNDLVMNSNIFSEHKNDEVVRTSFFRNSSPKILTRYRRIARGGPEYISFDWVLEYPNKHVQVRLANNIDSLVPTNLFAFIGNNGVGKTSILKDIVVSAAQFGKPVESTFFEHELVWLTNHENRLKEDAIDGITSLVFISYSSFDIFQQDFVDAFNMNSNFHFIGNRHSKEKGNTVEQFNTNLNPTDISSDIESDIEWIYYSPEKKDLFNTVMESFSWDTKLMDYVRLIEDVSDTVDETGDRNRVLAKTLKLSSGQKIILSMLKNLVKFASENALFIIDEPELYLHPPYSLALVLAINKLVNLTNSACVITTHSAITVQETPKENVFVIRGSDNEKIISNPKNETFGSDIGTINDEVFGVDIRNTGFYHLLDELIKTDDESVNELLNSGKLGQEAIVYLSILRSRNV